MLLFFFNDTATTEIYTLSLHDALPIWRSAVKGLIEGTESFGSAAGLVLRSVERGIVDMLGTTVSKLAAGPLAGLLNQPAGLGHGAGDVLGCALRPWLFCPPQPASPTAVSRAEPPPPRPHP